jgi:hypothetical protein
MEEESANRVLRPEVREAAASTVGLWSNQEPPQPGASEGSVSRCGDSPTGTLSHFIQSMEASLRANHGQQLIYRLGDG